MTTFSTTRVAANRDAVERIANLLRKTNATGAYFDEGIAVIYPNLSGATHQLA